MNLLSWNCLGLGNAPTVQELRELALKFAPRVLCILETQISQERAESLAYDSSFAVGSIGQSGGLVLYWNNEIKVEILGYSQYHIDD